MRTYIHMDEFYNRLEEIHDMVDLLNEFYRRVSRKKSHYFYHPIRNYQQIIRSSGNYFYVKPEIIQTICLPTNPLQIHGEGETIAIIKTFWLRIVQRTWKRVYSQRKLVLNKRKCIASLKYRETRGHWLNHDYPTLKGMLQDLLPN